MKLVLRANAISDSQAPCTIVSAQPRLCLWVRCQSSYRHHPYYRLLQPSGPPRFCACIYTYMYIIVNLGRLPLNDLPCQTSLFLCRSRDSPTMSGEPSSKKLIPSALCHRSNRSHLRGQATVDTISRCWQS
jgi:hypothetical protein